MLSNNRFCTANCHAQNHTIRWLLWFLLLFSSQPLLYANTEPLLHHDLKVEIAPETGNLLATDTLQLGRDMTELQFLLNADLSVELIDPAGSLTTEELLQGTVPIKRYRIQLTTPSDHFTLQYKGTIAHTLRKRGELSSLRQSTPGKISKEGVFLGGSSYWYPQVGSTLVSFSLQVALPEGWLSVSQGSQLADKPGWQELQPQEEIYLIAAPYHRYERGQLVTLAEVYLRKDNAELADRYLQATQKYLDLYEKLIGPYPYSKFSLVENFWESGYGMPSFTLLGPQVIQLPFIINTSYPHEILHNWWGNGVYIDATSGNWSEGLTTYLADHLLKEQQGQGANYRRNALQNYANYVTQQDDFPLLKFRGNQGQISQSIGYGKTLMLFHMLREIVGDELFLKGLQSFYRDYKFRRAGFDQIRNSFEKVSEKSLERFFSQWLSRTGAPTLKLVNVTTEPLKDRYRLSVTLEQTQAEAPFLLNIPLFISGAGQGQTEWHSLEMKARKTTWVIETKLLPIKLAIDPRFDLFRHLDPSEIPSTLGQLFGAKKVAAILPSAAEATLKQAYLGLISQWQQRQPGLSIIWDNQIDTLPTEGHLWIIGARNRFKKEITPLLESSDIDLNTSSQAMAFPHSSRPNQTIGFIQSDTVAAIAGLTRKLPHYGRYSYALFNGDEPQIVQRGEWAVNNSALSWIIESDYSEPAGELTDHPPLAQ